MSRLTDYPNPEARARAEDERYELRERYGRGGLSGWVVTGLVVAGLGALAWYYLGPDLRRYLKIKSM
jgi:hypothetical protein